MPPPTNGKRNKKQRKSNRWQKQKKAGDPVMEGGHPDDLVIPLMGPTGVGKSTFINKYFGQQKAEVGDSLLSCTRSLAWYPMILPDGPFKGRRLVLVDTPGFDDTYVDDSEILRRIAVWLAASYADDMSLAGVLYLHDICQKRMLGSTRMNLEMFEKLVGLDRKKRSPPIALVTTQWDVVPAEVGAKREEELKGAFWKNAIASGAKVHRADGATSYGRIVDAVLSLSQLQESETTMLIQEELVEKERSIPFTQAGRRLRYDLDELLKYQAEAAKNAEDEQKRKEMEMKRDATQSQRDALTRSMKDRVSTWARKFSL